MIKSTLKKEIKKYSDYEIEDFVKDWSREELEHQYEAAATSFMLANQMLEEILYALQKGECTDVNEAAKFIDDNLLQVLIYSKFEDA